MGLTERIKRTSTTDWLLTWFTGVVAVFTAVLALTSIYQFFTIESQLEVMREDQRPWAKITVDVPPEVNRATQAEMTQQLAAIDNVTYPIKIVNVGKTPAIGIQVDIDIEIVPKNAGPSFNYPGTHETVITGVLFPNDPYSFPANLLNPDRSVAQLSSTQRDDLATGRSYIAVYGKATYADSSGAKHWTQFCWWTAYFRAGSSNASSCVAYNDIDRN
jgi:hypothetical protein